jgi:hypothetical protein
VSDWLIGAYEEREEDVVRARLEGFWRTGELEYISDLCHMFIAIPIMRDIDEEDVADIDRLKEEAVDG